MDETNQRSRSTVEDLFNPDPATVAEAVRDGLTDRSTELGLPAALAASGLPAAEALSLITPYVRGGARALGDPGFLAHMDPPTPWVSWVASLLAASSNQNLLHPDTAPAARHLEAAVMAWLSPVFAMAGGHLVPGSTVANLTAMWAARDLTGATTVVASSNSHLSIRKAAAILGLRYIPVPVPIEPVPIDPVPAGNAMAPPSGPGAMSRARLADRFAAAPSVDRGDPPDPETTIVVLTAGTTGVGAVDELTGTGWPRRPAWVHIDAAWAGPLRFSDRYRPRLDGIEGADSVAVSAHKLLYQPKESALVLFEDVESANAALSLDGAYLQVPNIGVLGSHGATAAPLVATLLTLGRDGLAMLIDRVMSIADELVELVVHHPRLEVLGPNVSGVVAWRHLDHDSTALRDRMTGCFVSTLDVGGTTWLRSVAANPMADPARVVAAALAAADS